MGLSKAHPLRGQGYYETLLGSMYAESKNDECDLIAT